MTGEKEPTTVWCECLGAGCRPSDCRCFMRRGPSEAAPLTELINDHADQHDEIARLRAALAGLVERNTQIAHNSYSLCRGGEWVLTDEVWRESDPEEFALIEAARKALGPQVKGQSDG